jgi:hypothetical protein
MKTSTMLKLAAIAASGVAAYLVVSRTIKAGGKVAEGIKTVVTQDLNPASDKNIIYKNISESAKEKIGNLLGYVFDYAGYKKYKENLAALAAPLPVSKSQIEKEKALLRKMERSYNDPFDGVKTQDPYAAPEDYPINF